MNKYNAFFFCQYSIDSETIFYTALTSNKILLHTGILPLKNCGISSDFLVGVLAVTAVSNTL